MEDKKEIKNTDEYRVLEPGELEASGGVDDLDWERTEKCTACGSGDIYLTGNTKKGGLFNLATYYEYHCNKCGRDFWL